MVIIVVVTGDGVVHCGDELLSHDDGDGNGHNSGDHDNGGDTEL